MKKFSYHHGNLKQAIINEALKLLNQNNEKNFSFRNISRNIGVVSSAPYNHFKDKKDLLNELIIVGENKLLESLMKEKKKSICPFRAIINVSKGLFEICN